MPATVWKILSKNSPGTGSTFGADDWDMPGRYMHDIDFTATDPSSIKTNTSYWDNRLRLWNPASTFSYNFRSQAILANRDVTFPVLTANDEFVMLLATQTPQNKVININQNTLKHSSTNAVGDLLVGNGTQYSRLAMGSTGGHVLSIKNDLTGLEWVAGGAGGGETNTASNVGTAGVGVFKQKSGVDLQFKKLNTASGGLITITDDVANSEVDLKITAGTNGQILTTSSGNATWATPSGSAEMMPDGYSYSGARDGKLIGGSFDGEGQFCGFYEEATRGVAIGGTLSRTRWTSDAVDADLAGWSTWLRMTRRQQTPRFKTKFQVNPSTERVFTGF